MTIIKVFFAFFTFCFTSTSIGVISTEEVGYEALERLCMANSEMAFELHRSIASRSTDNVFFSPLSISTALGMLFYGARGYAAQELREVLGYEEAGLPSHLVHHAFKRYLRDVLKDEDSSAGYVLHTANAILVDKNRCKLLKDYREKVQECFRAVVKDEDVRNNAPKILEIINIWVKKKTNGKIKQLLKELNPSSVFVLLNAMYFKGTWKIEFDPAETRDEIFYNYGLEAEAKRVRMMHMRGRLPFAAFADFQALELPYKGGKVSMLIFLPNKQNGLEYLQQNLTPESLEDVQSVMKETLVDVSFPKFKLKFEEELSEDVKALGANEIFFPGSADLSAMTSSRNVFLNQVLHKAVIEVNEEGSEAAAATAGVVARIAMGSAFTANHPFLFIIVEKGSGSNMILFLGCVDRL